MLPSAQAASADIISAGYARFNLADTEADCLRKVVAAARAFFSLAPEHRARYANTEMNLGFRSIGHAYEASDRPDWNECFTLWSDRVDLVPRSEEIKPLLAAALDWRSAIAALLTDVLRQIGQSFGVQDASIAKESSFVQINSYSLGQTDRDLLQEQHEDGYVLTAIHTTDPGLEVRVDGVGDVPIDTAPGEVLLMPGLILADLTQGSIPALRHQVRNHHVADRISVMYFGGADMSRPLRAWAGGTGHDDLRTRIRSRPTAIRL